MSLDPRTALTALTAALEEHLAAASARQAEEDPQVEAAFLSIIDAFEVYEEVLFDAFDEVTPLVVYGDDSEAFDDEDDQDDGENQDSQASDRSSQDYA